MAKLLLLQSSHLTAPIHRRAVTAILSSKSLFVHSSLSHLHFSRRFSLSLPSHYLPLTLETPSSSSSLREPSRNFSTQAFDSSSETKAGDEKEQRVGKEDNGNGSEVRVNSESVRSSDEEYPSGEFQFEKPGAWKSFVVKLRMLVAFPWERVRKGSVLTMKLRGQVFLSFLPLAGYIYIYIIRLYLTLKLELGKI